MGDVSTSSSSVSSLVSRGIFDRVWNVGTALSVCTNVDELVFPPREAMMLLTRVVGYGGRRGWIIPVLIGAELIVWHLGLNCGHLIVRVQSTEAR